MLTKYLAWSFLWCFSTWNVGMVERINMMMEERRNRELTITNTRAAEEELGSSKRVQMTLRSRAQQSPWKWSICSSLSTPWSTTGSSHEALWKLINDNMPVSSVHHFQWRIIIISIKDLVWQLMSRPGRYLLLPGECRHSRARDREHWDPSTPAPPQSPWDRRSRSGGARPSGRGRGCSRRPAGICRSRTLYWPGRMSHRERGSPLCTEGSLVLRCLL